MAGTCTNMNLFLRAAEQLRKHSGLKCSFTVRHTQWVTVKPYWAKIILCSRRSPIQGHPVLFNSQSSALVHPNAIMELISCLYFPRHFTHYTNMVVESGIYCTRTQTKKTINPLWVVPIYRNTETQLRMTLCSEVCIKDMHTIKTTHEHKKHE